MKRGIALGWVFLWTARPQRRALQLFQTKYPTSKIFNYGECSEKRENMPLAGASPLAWLLATPPNGELARRLEKMTKARQIPGGGGGGGGGNGPPPPPPPPPRSTASHYDISSRALESLRLSKISDDFPKTPKCPDQCSEDVWALPKLF